MEKKNIGRKEMQRKVIKWGKTKNKDIGKGKKEKTRS